LLTGRADINLLGPGQVYSLSGNEATIVSILVTETILSGKPLEGVMRFRNNSDFKKEK